MQIEKRAKRSAKGSQGDSKGDPECVRGKCKHDSDAERAEQRLSRAEPRPRRPMEACHLSPISRRAARRVQTGPGGRGEGSAVAAGRGEDAGMMMGWQEADKGITMLGMRKSRGRPTSAESRRTGPMSGERSRC